MKHTEERLEGMSDLQLYIENMKLIEKEASIRSEAGILMMASYARKTAEAFKDKLND